MPQYPLRSKRSEAYENLISSFDTENDFNDVTLENLTTPDIDRNFFFFLIIIQIEKKLVCFSSS